MKKRTALKAKASSLYFTCSPDSSTLPSGLRLDFIGMELLYVRVASKVRGVETCPMSAAAMLCNLTFIPLHIMQIDI